MVRHRTFSKRHLVNFVGDKAIKELEIMRNKAEAFIEKELGEAAVITVTETSDAYASTVTIWYRKG
jgi:hypothetical protein